MAWCESRYRLPARGNGHEQPGRRYAVVLQPFWLTLSTRIVASTSTGPAPRRAAKPASRPPVETDGRRTLVLCDQSATVDLFRLAELAGFLTLDEMQRVDEALPLVLGW